ANPPSIGVDFFEGPNADLELIFQGGSGDGIDNDGDGLIDEVDTTFYQFFRDSEDYEDFPIVYEGDGIDNDRDGVTDEPDEKITMSKFVYYDNNFSVYGNPQNLSDYYNYLTARWKNGDRVQYGGNGNTTSNGEETDFMFPDDPRDPDGWSEVTANNQPFDRRFLQSAGAFTLKPGAVNKVTVGVVWARASSGGNTGSYDLLLLADDKAQKLFNNNFDLLDGPDAPELAAVELDKEVILMMDRETYIETESYEDSEVSTEGEEVKYGFQGYQLYQLSSSSVTPDQLGEADLAREIWQVDIVDGIKRLVNKEFDAEVDASIPEVMVDGNDEGLAHVIRITDDAFASGNSTLINHKTYHFLLIAYASVDAENTNEERQYLAGRQITRISVTPRETDILYDGTILNSAYGDGPEITRIEGKGNGGIFTRLTEATVDNILAENVYKQPTYQIGAGPVEVKIIDPTKVPNADFELRFIDKDVAGTDGEDLLASVEDQKSTLRDRQDEYALQLSTTETSKQNLELVIESLISKEDSLVIVENALTSGSLNQADSIVYAAAKTLLTRQISDLKSDTAVVGADYATELDELAKALNRLNNATVNLRDEQTKADSVIWILTKINSDGTREELRAEKGLYTDNEMVVGEWGMSIKAGPEYEPLGNSDDTENGLIGSEIVFENDANEWLSAMPQVENSSEQAPWVFDWIRAGGNLNGADPATPAIHDVETTALGPLDEGGVYKSVANGLIAPYMLTSRSTTLNGFSTFGVCQSPSYALECENIVHLPSIDLVFTEDRTKWSRVIVAEMGEDPGKTEGGANKFEIRQHASLELEPDANGNPVYSNTSVGFSWFPGYAIDVETGERLNIIIGENSSLPKSNTRDMIWNPSAELVDANLPPNVDGGAVIGGMHYIYVMGTKSEFGVGGGDYETAYDGCDQYFKYLNPASPDYKTNTFRGVWSAAMWVMPALLADGYNLTTWKDGLIPTETTIRTRINRPYRTYATSENPENENMPYYKFSTGSVAPEFSYEHGAEVLKNVRVVPNPYYAQSDYENSQVDNYVKITNLPEDCTIKIYTVNGQLVKTFNKSASGDYHNTELLWDLKNEARVPISSGVYVLNIEAPNIGEFTTVKFMAIIKPIDLDTF
ncbi:MAG: T9SS type A sorting domain-containing protein, partial [Bacteroidia bacterium]